MRLTVFRNKHVRSWPRFDQGDRAFVLDAGRAMRRKYSSDAHCAAYLSPNGRRLSSGAVGKVPIVLTAFVGDFDCPEVHGSPEPAPDSWRRAELEKVRALAAEHPGVFAPDSRGGFRVVYALPEPVEIHDRNDVYGWTRFYKIALAFLARRFGLVGDGACSDWTRLYRLPRATRDPKTGPEDRAAFGDPDEIGVFTFEPSDEDVTTATEKTKRAPAKPLDFSTSAIGDGLLFHLLDAAGDMGPDAPRGGRIVRCPNRLQHSVLTDWTDSTVWFPPAAGKEIGAIFCQHAHCRDLAVKDWLAFYSETDKDRARERAGIQSRGRRAAA